MKYTPDQIQDGKDRSGDEYQDGSSFEVHDSSHIKCRDQRKNQIVIFIYNHKSLHDSTCIYDDGRKQDKVDKDDVCPVVAYPSTELLGLSDNEIDDEGDNEEQCGD